MQQGMQQGTLEQRFFTCFRHFSHFRRHQLAGLARYAASAITVLGLVALNFLYSTKLVALNPRYYQRKWAGLNVAAECGMTPDELNNAGRILLAYLSGKISSPQTFVMIEGSQRPLFNDRELLHLRDVRALFQLGLVGIKLAWAATLLGLAYFLACFLVWRDGYTVRALASVLKISGLLCAAILAVLSIPAVFDFDGWWTGFHLVTFNNDLWRLDPGRDWLIRMFPEEFFSSAVTTIAMYSALLSCCYLVSGLLVSHLTANHRS